MARKKKNTEKVSNEESAVVGSLLADAAEQLSSFDDSNEDAFIAETPSETESVEMKSDSAEDATENETFEAASESVSVEMIEPDDSAADSEREASAGSQEDSEELETESSDELAEFGSTNIYTEEEPESFIPEASDFDASEETLPNVESVEGTELDSFEAADIEEVEFVEDERLDSILESILFASDRPVSLASLKLVFKGTNIRGDKLKRALDRLAVELAGSRRGVTLEEVPGGYQLRTKVDNIQFLTRTLKARQFKLSGPALEVLAIVAYKQPVVKHEIDEIRGVESGHLLRALMEKGLVTFEGKSDLPGKPMQYATTRKFLEIFSLRNLKELPTLSQIDELLPEGMTEEEAKPTLSQVTESMSQAIGSSYSEGEDELNKITDQLTAIDTSSEFFEQEKLRQKQKRDEEKAQNIREALALGEEVPTRDRNWLAKYDEALLLGQTEQFAAREGQDSAPADSNQQELVAVSAETEERAQKASEAVLQQVVSDDTAELEAALAAAAEAAFENDDIELATTNEDMTEIQTDSETIEVLADNASDATEGEDADEEDDDRSGEAQL